MSDSINLNELTREQVEALCVHYEESLVVLSALNNTLISRLGALNDFEGEGLATLNEWSERVNLTHLASEQEIRRIVAPNSSAASSSIPQNKLN